jgi:hypothetical protein
MPKAKTASKRPIAKATKAGSRMKEETPAQKRKRSAEEKKSKAKR